MRTYPIFLDLSGRRALVLGDGEVAERKAQPLVAAGASVVHAVRFEPGLLDGVAIAIGADAPEAELRALSAAAMAAGVPVNVVDRPELCSFITPSIVDRDPLIVAVSSGGVAPVLARIVRARIEVLLAPGIARLGAFAERWKARTRAALPDVVRRRRLLEATLGGRVADLVLAGDEAAAEAEYGRLLAAAEAGRGGGEPGIVYLVGAGPGAADLVTLRAQRLLGEADVIVHDRLVGEGVLELARRDAERVYVGKARSNHALPQEEINALLVRLAREGKRVVRLKGGDPFVFGRGGEEMEALQAAGVAVEIVPGITAALACAAGAQVPLTHREAAQSLTLVTGHLKGSVADGHLDLDFEDLARPGKTVAIYMGLATLPRLAAGLRAAGMPDGHPAMLVERGGTERQRILRGTLASVVAEASGWSDGGATLVILGEVVARQGPEALPASPGTTL